MRRSSLRMLSLKKWCAALSKHPAIIVAAGSVYMDHYAETCRGYPSRNKPEHSRASAKLKAIRAYADKLHPGALGRYLSIEFHSRCRIEEGWRNSDTVEWRRMLRKVEDNTEPGQTSNKTWEQALKDGDIE